MKEDFLARVRKYTNIYDDIDTDSAAERIKSSIWFKGPNAWILAFAIILASVGLNVNSTAVIIGAMLVSFEESTGVLFSADAFGKFGALSKTAFWADEDDWACEARRYYFNICGKYGPQVSALLKKLPAPSLIAPLHGPLMRNDLSPYLNLYNIWSSYGVESEGVMVAYASIHGGTAAVAERFAKMLKAKGCPKVVLCDLTRDDRAEAIEDAFRYGTLVVAAASYDAGLFTPAYEFIHSLQMKGWQKRKVGLIENGTWAPSAGRVMKEMFLAMKDVEIVGDLVTIKSVYTHSDEPALEALANAVIS